MENEIKEILDFLEGIVNEKYAMPNGQELLNEKEIKILLDYITNLQEENDYLTKKLNEEMIKSNKLLDNRDKALKYIKKMCYIDDDYGYCNYGDDLSPQHLVDILQGSDK